MELLNTANFNQIARINSLTTGNYVLYAVIPENEGWQGSEEEINDMVNESAAYLDELVSSEIDSINDQLQNVQIARKHPCD